MSNLLNPEHTVFNYNTSLKSHKTLIKEEMKELHFNIIALDADII